jgi:UDP-N-acetylglucosamine 1-carboxyvinyltransferase
MRKYVITGGKKLEGKIKVSGAKNVALKVIVASCLTSEKVTIHNVPLISDVFIMLDLVKEIGGEIKLNGHTLEIQLEKIKTHQIPLEAGAKIRTSTLFLAPLLARMNEAVIPNPGGCRIGARPIDRIVDGLKKMNTSITYNHKDGYFHAKTRGLTGTTYKFEKNSHTGTETLILAAVLARGKTIIENAAMEPEVDCLIGFLNKMGAQIKRLPDRRIEINGVGSIHGTEYILPQDRNEVVTFAVAGILTGGKVWIEDVDRRVLGAFIYACKEAGISLEEKEGAIRFYSENSLRPTDIKTEPYPGFMTDWQGPWAIAMTQAEGNSTIHETVYENRFGYKNELEKMGADISYVNDEVNIPGKFYNFNYDKAEKYNQKIEINGKTQLHNAVINISDLRSGATLVIAALIVEGTSVVYGVEQVDRGYEDFDKRLSALGAEIVLEEDKV